MRVWVVLVVLAGCSAPIQDPGPTSPLHTGGSEDGAVEVKHVPMDPVKGAVTADGIMLRYCNLGIGGGGSITVSRPAWTFEVGSNATSLQFKADWTPKNPTLERLGFELSYAGKVLAVLEGPPGLAGEVGVGDLEPDDRRVSVRIAQPPCDSLPAATQHFDGVQAQLNISFKA